MRVVRRIGSALVAVLFVTFPSPILAQSNAVIGPFLGRTLTIPVPTGNCVLNRDSKLGRIWYSQQEKMNAGINLIGVIFVDCNELRKKEQDGNYIVNGYGIVMIVTPEGKLNRYGEARADFVKSVAGGKLPTTTELENKVNDAIQKLDSPTASSVDRVVLGLLGVDDTAAYYGQGMTLDYPKGRIRQNMVTAITVVRTLPVALHLYAFHDGGAPFKALMARSKQFATEVVRVNSP